MNFFKRHSILLLWDFGGFAPQKTKFLDLHQEKSLITLNLKYITCQKRIF